MLRDRVRTPIRALFVGINPGMRSAAIGHHFAGYSNRFWKLLYESGLIPEPIGTDADGRLPEWGFGITNLVPRATPGIDTLTPKEYIAGLQVLRRKVRRWHPAVVVFVGVTLYRLIRRRTVAPRQSRSAGARLPLGIQEDRFEGATVFVLPNPSGRNANYTYAQMLDAYRSLAVFLNEND
jgi:TDG/mug DNA glycosylase family protein